MKVFYMSENSKPAEEQSSYPKEPVQTQHNLKIGKKILNYFVTAGIFPLRNLDTGEVEANVFFIAYTLDSPQGDVKRPLTFAFNGGPGSSSVWLHLGALGPRRVKMLDDGSMPAPPYQLVDNPHTWLEDTDLVFIDPVGTGYSRATKTDHNKKFWSLKGDFESVVEIIRLYLTRYQRWASPLFLAGESYGTTRAAALAGQLVDRGIAFNGVFLISTILNFQTARFTLGNDLPYLLFLPTYTATAWYHGKLPDDLQKRPLRDVLDEVENWIISEYNTGLMKGDSITDTERSIIIQQLSRYTGLGNHFIENSNLRIEIFRFCKELLRNEKRTVGRLDTRFKGTDILAVTEYPEFDPSYASIAPPYTAMMNQYVRGELHFETDLEYEILSFKVNGEWNWETQEQGYPDTSELLRTAFAKNPHMKVFFGLGYYDLATPYYATIYTLNHMGISPEMRTNIKTADYQAGHMMYIDMKALQKFKADIADFIQFAL
jgi:carboxypeptidase C (cathepsin A)